MKTTLLFFLIAAFLTFSNRKNGETNLNANDDLYAAISYCNEKGSNNVNIDRSLGSSLLQGDHHFSNFKLFVQNYFIPENTLGLVNTGVILYSLENLESETSDGHENYTKGITFISECLGALSLEFSYNSTERDLQLKADVSDAYGRIDHLLDYSINLNPCTAEPIASLLATLRNTFGGNEC